VKNAGPEIGGPISLRDLNWNKTQKVMYTFFCVLFQFKLLLCYAEGCSPFVIAVVTPAFNW